MESVKRYFHPQHLWARLPGWKELSGVLRSLRIQPRRRRLQLCETLSLGEKRVVAVVQYEGQKFLIGGGAQAVNLLARLGAGVEFSDLLTEWCERQR